MRNLIPMLVLVMSWPIVGLTPARYSVGKTYLQSGETIKNAHDKERKIKRQTYIDAKRYYDSVAGPYQGLSKDSLRRRGLYTGILKKASGRLEKAKDQYMEVNKWWHCVQEDILEYSTNDPKGSKELRELIGSNGHVIYVYFGRKDMRDTAGATRWGYYQEYDQFYAVVGGDTLNDAFLIDLNMTARNADEIIAHEQGHIVDIIKRPMLYKENEGEWNSLNCRAQEHRNDRFVKPARDAEDTFILRKGRLKAKYIRKPYDKKWWRDWLDATLK